MTTNKLIGSEEYARSRVMLLRVAIAVLGVFALFATACGIDFGEASTETEIFNDLTIEGSFVPGGTLVATLSYAQQYDVKLKIQCDLLSVEDIPTVTPLPTGTLSPLTLVRTPEPTLPRIPLVRPTPTNKLREIFGTTLEPNNDGGPVGEATPVLGTVEMRFLAPEAGEYLVWCYTPLDLNNAVIEELTIAE